jgi:hypothetical protein
MSTTNFQDFAFHLSCAFIPTILLKCHFQTHDEANADAANTKAETFRVISRLHLFHSYAFASSLHHPFSQ